MKKSHIITIVLSILAPVLAIIIGISMVRAWYTKIVQTGELDATSKNVAIKYQLNNSAENVTTYTINNLAFFDADSEDEGEFLNLLALKIDLVLTNNADNETNYTIIFESTKTTLVENEVTKSRAYAACAFDSVAKDTANHKTVNSYLQDSETTTATNTYDNSTTNYTATKVSKVNLKAKDDPSDGDETTISLYVFGIQDIDTASSKDFLYTDANKTDVRSYTFTITIIAEPQGAAVVTNNSED